MKRFAILFLALFTVLVPSLAAFSTASAAPASFNDANFQTIWQRWDQLVQTDPNAGRSWTWGPNTLAGSPATEQYNGSTRTVQYFDKARMEVNNPNGDRGDLFFVTTGLLVKELVTGLRQDGDNTFTSFPNGAATIPVAGDPNDNTNNFGNPSAPTYASFKNVVTFNGDHYATPATDGNAVNASIDMSGNVGTIVPTASPKFVANAFDNVTHHNMVDVFINFMNQGGRIYNTDNGQYNQSKSIYVVPLYVFGHPVSEPYWVTTKVNGTAQAVLVQLFERRVLTYTPSNPAAFQVEMGNIGQHYYKWRYIVNNPSNTPTPTPTPTPSPTITTTDYSQFRAPYNKANGSLPTGGTVAISYNSGSPIHTSPALDSANNLAFFGTDGRGVFAVDVTTATTKWRFSPPGVSTTPTFAGSPLFYNGVVYIGANDGKVYAINESDGSQKWASPAAGGPVTGVPATDGTNIYFAGRDGKIYSYDLATGQNSIWQFSTNLEIDGGPILGTDGTLYFGTNSASAANSFYAINSKNGQKIWQTAAAASGEGFLAQAALVPSGSVLYVGTTKGNVYAYNTPDGSTKWAQAVTGGAAIGTTPAITSQGLFVGSDNGTEYLRDPNNGGGNATWLITLPSGAAIRSSTAVVDGVVYFGADNGKVYGFDANNYKNQKFQASTTAAISYNSPIVSNGVVYITSTDGFLYAFK